MPFFSLSNASVRFNFILQAFLPFFGLTGRKQGSESEIIGGGFSIVASILSLDVFNVGIGSFLDQELGGREVFGLDSLNERGLAQGIGEVDVGPFVEEADGHLELLAKRVLGEGGEAFGVGVVKLCLLSEAEEADHFVLAEGLGVLDGGEALGGLHVGEVLALLGVEDDAEDGGVVEANGVENGAQIGRAHV